MAVSRVEKGGPVPCRASQPSAYPMRHTPAIRSWVTAGPWGYAVEERTILEATVVQCLQQYKAGDGTRQGAYKPALHPCTAQSMRHQQGVEGGELYNPQQLPLQAAPNPSWVDGHSASPHHHQPSSSLSSHDTSTWAKVLGLCQELLAHELGKSLARADPERSSHPR